jgi:ketosteroid isomerase-like protein
MNNEEATKIVSKLYNEWADALTSHRAEWFERHIADDFALTAHPFSKLRLDKKEFIAVDMQIENTQIKFLDIKATSAGEILISQAVAEVKEDFKADLGAGMPSAAEVTNLLSGKVLAYASAWRKKADVWQCFDHHMIGPVQG